MPGISTGAIIPGEPIGNITCPSASTLQLRGDSQVFHVSGTVTITAISDRSAGSIIALVFDAACQVTYNATTLILQGAVNFTSAAGDVLMFESEGPGIWREVSRRLATPGTAVVTSIAKFGDTPLTGAVTLTGGSGITLTEAGQDISIAATATNNFTALFPLVATQINRSSIGDTYVDVAGNTFAETTHQTRITLGSRTRTVTMKLSGHVSGAGTGSFRIYNVTDASALGATKTTTSNTEVSLTSTTSTLDTNQSDEITIQVANSAAGESVTIDSGGFADSDDSKGFSATGNTSTVNTGVGGHVTGLSYGFIEALSTSTFTAQLGVAAGQGTGSIGAANTEQVLTLVDSARSTFGTVWSFTPAYAVNLTSNTTVVIGLDPSLYLNVSAAANLTNNAQICISYQVSGIATP